MDHMYGLLEYLTEKDAINILSGSNPWILETEEPINGSDSMISIAKHIFRALKETEYDFEQSCDGLTTLAMQLTERGRFSVEVAGIMLDCGANAHAICQGLDMFRFPMFRCEKESDREVLEQKFCLLIRAGVDVNFEDEVGMTTSECALEFGCWDEWCRALESNNLNIHEVIEMDEKRREHFRAQRMGETDPEDAEETDAEDDRETDAEDDETETGPEIDSEYGTEDVKENSMDGDTQQR